MGLGVEVLLSFWWDLAVDVPGYSIRWSELVLRELRLVYCGFDSTRFELVEGQQSYKRQRYRGAGRDQSCSAAVACLGHGYCWRDRCDRCATELVA